MPAKLVPVDVEKLTLESSGNSANIDFYRADRAHRAAIYVEVLIDNFERVTQPDGTRTLRGRKVAIYRISIYRRGKTKWIEDRFTYEPRTNPKTGHLPASTVTKLVRERIRWALAMKRGV